MEAGGPRVTIQSILACHSCPKVRTAASFPAQVPGALPHIRFLQPPHPLCYSGHAALVRCAFPAVLTPRWGCKSTIMAVRSLRYGWRPFCIVAILRFQACNMRCFERVYE